MPLTPIYQEGLRPPLQAEPHTVPTILKPPDSPLFHRCLEFYKSTLYNLCVFCGPCRQQHGNADDGDGSQIGRRSRDAPFTGSAGQWRRRRPSCADRKSEPAVHRSAVSLAQQQDASGGFPRRRPRFVRQRRYSYTLIAYTLRSCDQKTLTCQYYWF